MNAVWYGSRGVQSIKYRIRNSIFVCFVSRWSLLAPLTKFQVFFYAFSTALIRSFKQTSNQFFRAKSTLEKNEEIKCSPVTNRKEWCHQFSVE